MNKYFREVTPVQAERHLNQFRALEKANRLSQVRARIEFYGFDSSDAYTDALKKIIVGDQNA